MDLQGVSSDLVITYFLGVMAIDFIFLGMVMISMKIMVCYLED
jgi:hypothetical protein